MKRVAIITSSDTGYRGEREDLSGPAIKEIAEKNGYEVVSMRYCRMIGRCFLVVWHRSQIIRRQS